MQLNRCCRCGSFFTTTGDVCPNCMQKDMYEMSQLRSFLEESDITYSNTTTSLESISQSTGISVTNLSRYLSNEIFSDFTIL